MGSKRAVRAFECKMPKVNSTQDKNKQGNYSRCQGSLKIAGIGPGDAGLLSQRAKEAIRGSRIIVGYAAYIKLIEGMVRGKEIFSSGMTRETERAAYAIKMAGQGNDVCLVSGGDPGIYGMAGLVLELLSREDAKRIKIEVVPGVSAAGACAALLGAPLSNDFAVISLSDLLTERKEIERRLLAAARADFVIALYNPKSTKRTALLEKAWQILLRYRKPNTPVGVVKNAYRDGQKIIFTSLKAADSINDIDMTTTIIVGNSKTRIKNGSMLTLRGYDVRNSKNML